MMDKWVLVVILKALASASPRIVAALRQMVQELVDRASETENPWDDVLTELLQTIVGKPGDVTEDGEKG